MAAGTTIRVVLVDDAAEIRAMVRLALELDGRFEVVGEAGDGEEGIELVAAAQPDVVVLDVEMPVLGGLEALPGLRERAPGTRVLMYSSHAEFADQALASGADAYRVKDSNLHELTAVLAALASTADTAPA